MRRLQIIATIVVLLAGASIATVWLRRSPNPSPDPSDGRIVTQGLATTTTGNLFACGNPNVATRNSAVGTATARDGSSFTVPADTAFPSGSTPTDLFNECTGVTPRGLAEANVGKVPIVDVDAGGDVITGVIVADNYFELYVNGTLVGVDAVPYTPFNAQIVRFRAKKPYTYAFKAVDWEEKLGLGMERLGADAWHPGDGGLVATFSDGTVTDHTWKAQSYYIAPLTSPDDVVARAGLHDTSALGRVYPLARPPDCREACFAVHYRVPTDWAAREFADGDWPFAYEYSDQDAGGTGLAAYAQFPEAFRGARWIWTVNLVFDNVVLARKTVT